MLVKSLVVSAGGSVDGAVNVVLDEPTLVSDVYVRLRGVSDTSRLVQRGNTTYRVYERHVHIDRTYSLLPLPRDPTVMLAAGRHTFPISLQLPIHSDCTCLARLAEYARFSFSRWTCDRLSGDHAVQAVLLPPSLSASNSIKVKYKVAAVVQRAGNMFKRLLSNKSVTHSLKLLPVTLTDSDHYGTVNSITVCESRSFSAQCSKLPDEYFVPGSLPKDTGVRKIFSSLSSKYTYVNVPISFDMTLRDNATATLNQRIPINIYAIIDVDSVSRLLGVLDMRLSLVRVSIESVTRASAQKHINVASNNTLLYELKNIDVPLITKSESEQKPRFRIDDEFFANAVVTADVVPDFSIMSMTHTNFLFVTIGVKFNNGTTRNTELKAKLVVTSGIEYDASLKQVLPPSYDPGDYIKTDDDNESVDEKMDFFDD